MSQEDRRGFRILLTVVFVLCLLVVSINGCKRSGYIDNSEDDKEGIVSKKKEIVEFENGIIAIQGELDEKQREIDVLNKHISSCPDTTKILIMEAVKPMLSKSYEIVNGYSDDLESKSNDIKEAKYSIAYLESEKRVLDNQKGIYWHSAWIRFIWKYILIPVMILFAVTFVNIEDIGGNLRQKAIDSPKSIFIVTKANGKFQVVFRRWWYTIEDKVFKSHEEAINYTDALNNEKMEDKWHKIK